MIKTDYVALRKQLASAGMLKSSNAVGIGAFLVETLLLVGGFALLTHLEPWSFAFVGVQILLGTSVFRVFVLMHDCGHYSLFGRRSLNGWFGSLASIVTLTPFVAWRDIHFEHHRWVGVIDKDPTSAGLIDFERSQQHSRWMVALLRFIWLFRIPLPSILFTVQVMWGYPIRLLKEGRARRSVAALFSMLIALGPHVALVGYAGAAFYLNYVLPTLFFSFLWYELINLTHHAGLYTLHSESHPESVPLHEQATFCRSAQMPAWGSLLLCYHFNLHTEHHLYPTVPFHHLPRVRSMLKAYPLPEYNGVSFPHFNQALRQADPVAVLLNNMPAHLNQQQYPLK
ncbi:MAG: fatty acid desaturase [Hahellaceae bacterium]|nr:fatty acid desaturase [Hahellaceae bacterium]MCP5168874.1 fatty acid desaturase [Hahellaceae bacterium]